jgi:hypothetical protein
MNLRILIFIIFLTGLSLSFAKENDDAVRLVFNYSHEYYTIDRAEFGAGGEFMNFLNVESSIIGYSHISDDSYNKGKANSSLAPTCIGLFSSLLGLLTEAKSETSVALVAIPVFLTNTMFYVPLEGHANVTVHIAPFIKNDTDYYMFREHKWGQITPGAGVRVFLRTTGIALGVERAFQSDFKGNTRIENMFFFRIGINDSFNAAMSV